LQRIPAQKNISGLFFVPRNIFTRFRAGVCGWLTQIRLTSGTLPASKSGLKPAGNFVLPAKRKQRGAAQPSPDYSRRFVSQNLATS
jgi:hypothetical protein